MEVACIIATLGFFLYIEQLAMSASVVDIAVGPGRRLVYIHVIYKLLGGVNILETMSSTD